jgi:hypothetical protein
MKKQRNRKAMALTMLIIVIFLFFSILTPITTGLSLQKENKNLLNSSEDEDFILTIHRLRTEDEIDPFPHSQEGEWELSIYVDNEKQKFEVSATDKIIDKSFSWPGIVKEGMKFIEVKMELLEKDLGYWPDDHDIADISAKVDEDYQNEDYDDTTDFDSNRPVVFRRLYDIKNDIWVEVDSENDFLQIEEDGYLSWFITSGNYDGSTAIDENDVSIWFDVNIGNTPPFTPEKPVGTSVGWIGEVYQFTTQSNDPDGDEIQFGWDWNGDDVIDEYTDFYDSWETVKTLHSWSLPRIFYIKVIAIDSRGLTSGWSEEFKVEVNGPYGKTGFEVHDWSLGIVVSQYYDHYETQEILDIIRSGGNIVTALATLISAVAAACGVPLDISLSITIVTALLRLGVEVINLMDRGMGIYVRAFIVEVNGIYLTSVAYAWSQSVNGKEGKEPEDNVAPDLPTIIETPESAKPGEELIISLVSGDKNSDEITYLVDWGDGNQTFSDFEKSDTDISLSHVYENIGYYIARIKVIDPYGKTSEWSEPIKITIESCRYKDVNNFLFFERLFSFFSSFNFLKLLNENLNFYFYK